MHTNTIMDRIIAVDYDTSLRAMIAAGRYDWANDKITPEHFPVEGTGMKRFRTTLIDARGYTSSEDAVAAMKAENFAPGDHVHGLAYGAAFPDKQLKNPIACLGSFARVRSFRFVVCLSKGLAVRCLGLDRWDRGWGDIWRFLAVQEVFDD